MPVDRLVSISLYVFVCLYIEVKLLYSIRASGTLYSTFKINKVFHMNFLAHFLELRLDYSRVSFLLHFFSAVFLCSWGFCVCVCVCRCNTVAALSPVVKQMLPSAFTRLCTLYAMPSPQNHWCHAKWGTQWICKNPAEYRYEPWVRLVCNLDLFLITSYWVCAVWEFSCQKKLCNSDIIFRKYWKFNYIIYTGSTNQELLVLIIWFFKIK